MSEYSPIIKKKNFCPSPVAKYGIADIADSYSNPAVVGTVAYEDWWNEQIDRCINGYQTGGLWIPGRYYWYLNFCKISTIERGIHYPEYVDIDYEFFLMVERAKAEGKGVITIKRRRCGVSYKFSEGVVGHGVRFIKGYKAGIVAGNQEYSKTFFDKFKSSMNNVADEFRVHELNSNQDYWRAGYEFKNAQGVNTEGGSLSVVMCKTAHKTSAVFKGEALDHCMFEESGEFDNLLSTYTDTKACFQGPGGKMLGVPFLFGTGGNIKSASKDFKEMYYKADEYGLIPFNILGPRMFVGMFEGSRNEKGELYDMPENIKKLVKEKKLSPEQVLGCEDVASATIKIHEDRKKLATAKDKKLYYGHLQDFPLSEKEAFLSFSGNDFSPEKLAEQAYNIGALTTSKYSKYRLEFVMDEKGSPKIPLQVEAIPERDVKAEERCVLIWEHPQPQFKNLDIAGIDSYDIDKSATSKSLGAIVIYRRYNNILIGGKPIASKKPIAVYYFRPDRKEEFYDICLKLCLYYNTKRSALVDVRNSVIIKHFEQYGGEKYLALRPESFESENSEQQHKYGFSLNVKSKPMMISLMQTWVHDNINGCWFPRIVEDLQGYDVSSKDSDWDAADALGIALVRDADMSVMVTGDQENKWDKVHLPTYRSDGHGNMVLGLSEEESSAGKAAKDPFIKWMENGGDMEDTDQ